MSLGGTKKLDMGQSVSDKSSFSQDKIFRNNFDPSVLDYVFSTRVLFCSSSFLNSSIL